MSEQQGTLKRTELFRDRYAMGLVWRPLVLQGDRGKIARRRAVEDKAEYYWHSSKADFIGLAHCAEKPKRGTEPPLALARVFALAWTTKYAFVAVRVSEDRAWICATREDTPQGDFDQILLDYEVRARYESFIRDAGVAANEVQTFGDVGDLPSQSFLDINRICAQADEYAAASVMQAVRFQISPKQVALVLTVLTVLLCNQQYKAWKVRQNVAARAAAQANEVPPEVMWRDAMVGWSKTRSDKGDLALREWRRSIGSMPVVLGGYALQSVQCEWGVSGANQAWTCAATYKGLDRGRMSPRARDFVAHIPERWTTSLKGTDRIVAAFGIDCGKFAPIQLTALPVATDVMLANVSRLQQLSVALQRDIVEEFVADADFRKPLSPTGGVLPMPTGASIPMIAKVRVSGPLRVVDALELTSTGWTKVSLSMDLAKVRRRTQVASLGGEASMPQDVGKEMALDISLAMVELQGVMYARPNK